MIGWLNDINRLVSKDKREPRVIPAENTHTHSRRLLLEKSMHNRLVWSHQRGRQFSFPSAAAKKKQNKTPKEWLAMFLETLQIVADRTLLAMWGGGGAHLSG